MSASLISEDIMDKDGYVKTVAEIGCGNNTVNPWDQQGVIKERGISLKFVPLREWLLKKAKDI
ncbi:MAG: hypothetical protein C0392_01860 [Syntrophus sp. (in: bacteria)]|nr:hypothetical protein [Syntrophus sp. (in: bacteria)]